MAAINTPSFTDLLRNPIHLLAFGFGSGLAPRAPGTFGTLVGIPFYLLMLPLSLIHYSVVLCLITVLGFYLCGQTAKDLGVHDHGGIVWDEIAGYLITMIAIPFSVSNILLGFVLFRFFDIVKPWPIRWLDKHIAGGVGIMLDDILAGVFAWGILWATNWAWPVLANI